jgi:hypothetical protein
MKGFWNIPLVFFFFFPSFKKSTYFWGKYEVFFLIELWKEFLNQVVLSLKSNEKPSSHEKSEIIISPIYVPGFQLVTCPTLV